MTLAISPWVRRSLVALAAAVVVAGSFACSGKAPSPAPAAPEKPQVTLLPEDAVRLSNDPAKTEIFRDAGHGSLHPLGAQLPDGDGDLLAPL